MAQTPAKRKKTYKAFRKHAQASAESSRRESDSELEPEEVEHLDAVEDEATWDGLSGVDGKPVSVFLFKFQNNERKKLVSQIEVGRLMLAGGVQPSSLHYPRISAVQKPCLRKKLTYLLRRKSVHSSKPSSKPPVQYSDARNGFNNYGMTDTSKHNQMLLLLILRRRLH